MLIMDILSYENIVGAILQVVDTICINISSAIYSVIGFLYQIFMALASAQIFTSDQYQNISKNIYYIIGVVALFLISYALLRAIIDPDGGGKSEYSVKKIIPNVLKSILLIAFVPALFSIAYNVQNVVIGTNVIPKIVLGSSYSDSGEGTGPNGKSFDYKTVGRETANLMFKSFLYPTDKVSEEEVEASDCYTSFKSCPDALRQKQKYSFKQASDDVENGDIDFAVYGNFAKFIHGEDKKLEYNGIFQIIAGVFAVYIFLNYCIDLGVRAVKLGYYQVIAPLPILTILIPGQNKVFNNWLKSTLSTFADVFIKIAILFFGLLLIKNMPDFGNLWNKSIFGKPDIAIVNFSKVFLIIGVLIFIKQAPKLITDLFGISAGTFKLGIKDKMSEALGGLESIPVAGNLGSRAVGAATGALGGGMTSALNGSSFLKGAKMGALNGAHDKGFQFQNMRKAAYTGLGFKGDPGIFGGPKLIDKMAYDSKNEYSDYFKDKVLPNWIHDQENSDKNPKWKEIYDAKLAAKKAERESAIKGVQKQRDAAEANYYSAEQVDARKQQFNDDVARRKSEVNYQLMLEEKAFNAYRDRQMEELKTTMASNPKDAAKFIELKNSKFEDSVQYQKLSSELNNLNSAQFVDKQFDGSAYDAQIEEVKSKYDKTAKWKVYDGETKKVKEVEMSQLEADVMKETRKEYRDLDETYDNRLSVYMNRMNEAKNKEFNNSEIGQQMKLFAENLNKINGGSDSASSGSSSSGGGNKSGEGKK